MADPRSRLFVALHQDLISDLHAPWELNGGATRVGTRPSWQSTSVAVEFHSGSIAVFWRHIVPRLAQLRARYASVGGRLVVVTTVRAPAPLIISWYRQWPPRMPNRTIARFEPWLHNASGLLTRYLAFVTGSPRIWHTTKVPAYACPPADVRTAISHLRTLFDLVGDVGDVGWTLARLVHCLGWPASEAPRTAPHQAYAGAWRALTMRETAGVLPAADEAAASSQHGDKGHVGGAGAEEEDRLRRVRCGLARAARCDLPVYGAMRGGWSRCGGHGQLEEGRGPLWALAKDGDAVASCTEQ